MRVLIAMTAMTLAACAPLTERQLEAREYRRLDFQARYHELRAECRAEGGMLYVEPARRLGRSSTPDPKDKIRCI